MTDLDEAVQARLGFYKRPDQLDASEVDPLIWPIVKRINESGWCWTAESCQGHPEAEHLSWSENVKPMLRLVTRRHDAGVMLDFLCAALAADDEAMIYGAGLAEVFPVRWMDDWIEVLVYLRATTAYSRNSGLRAFARFAESLNGR